MKQFDVSVCVLTYNPDISDLFTTVISCIKQVGINFELIVSDDGSLNNYQKELEALFKNLGFADYQFICHNNNHGTVKNCFDAVKNAKGRYIKLISPGDFFCNESALKKMVSFMDDNNCCASFSDLVFYRKGEIDKQFTAFSMPQNVRPYEGEDIKRQQLNYLVLTDWASGASWITEANLLKKYLAKIFDKVIYSEDSVYRLMLADGIPLKHHSYVSMFYQYGDGISTSANSSWKEKLMKDNMEEIRTILSSSLPSKRLKKYYRFVLSHNSSMNKIMRTILFPRSVIEWLRTKTHPRYSAVINNYGFISNCLDFSEEFIKKDRE